MARFSFVRLCSIVVCGALGEVRLKVLFFAFVRVLLFAFVGVQCFVVDVVLYLLMELLHPCLAQAEGGLLNGYILGSFSSHAIACLVDTIGDRCGSNL